MQGAA
jgi:hypothetical protein